MKLVISIVFMFAALNVLAESRIDFKKDEATVATQELLAKGHEIPDPCAGLVRECYTYGNDEFINCLSTASLHPFCANSALGRLASRRWAVTPGLEGADAFTGPAMMDRECLKKFDAELSGFLTQGNVSEDIVGKLQGNLSGCNREAPVDLLRP